MIICDYDHEKRIKKLLYREINFWIYLKSICLNVRRIHIWFASQFADFIFFYTQEQILTILKQSFFAKWLMHFKSNTPSHPFLWNLHVQTVNYSIFNCASRQCPRCFISVINIFNNLCFNLIFFLFQSTLLYLPSKHENVR